MSVGEHLREMRWRLAIVAAVFVAASGGALPFFRTISTLLVQPLGPDQQLVYLTPGGAFGYIMQVCCYVGLVAALPVAVYHVCQFIMPAISPRRRHVVVGYTAASCVLALAGVAFAYYICVPAALHFLTNFQLTNIQAMITIDAYLSFVMTYIAAGALLFQLPLIMLLVNTMTPLTPRRLMAFQGKLILGAFIVAAIISPTPDALNQTMLALPVVAMYQLGCAAVLWRNRSARRRAAG